MKSPLSRNIAGAGLSVLCLALFSCKKQDGASVAPTALNSSGQTSSLTPSGTSRQTDVGNALGVGDNNGSLFAFKYVELTRFLGRPLPAQVLRRLETDGGVMSKLKNVLIQGATPIVIDSQGQLPAVAYVKDGTLVALGYSFPSPVSQENEELVAKLLEKYTFLRAEIRNAIGSDFNAVEITIREHVSQANANFHAVSYVHEHSRTLVLYDSTAVNYVSMLPSSPESLGKDKLDNIKSEMARTRTLIEQAKVEKAARESKRAKNE